MSDRRIVVNNLGSLGINRDEEPHELPPEAFTHGRNVRFTGGHVENFSGHKQIFGTPSVKPYWAIAIPGSGSEAHKWMYGDLEKMYLWNGTSHTEVTNENGTYTVNATDLWSGGLFSGIPVITNGNDVPQALTDINGKLVDLPNWDSDVRCKILKPFKNFLVALNLTIGGAARPHMYIWSDAAEPGSLPGSWDYTDPTKIGGQGELEDDTGSAVRDAETLGDVFVIYKGTSIAGLQHTRGQLIMREFSILTTTGILAKDCVAQVPEVQQRGSKQHFVVTHDGIILHNTVQAEEITDRRWRKFLSNHIDTDNYEKSFVVPNGRSGEMWFCFPENNHDAPSMALVWDIRANTFGVRDLNHIPYIAVGNVVDTTDTTWTTETDNWEDATARQWDRRPSPRPIELLICDPTDQKLYHVDEGTTFAGNEIKSFVERLGLGVVGKDYRGEWTVDMQSQKLATRIWVRASGDPFRVRLGAQDEIDGGVYWAPAQVFTPGVDRYLDFHVAGKLLAVRFQSLAPESRWRIAGYDLVFSLLGEQ